MYKIGIDLGGTNIAAGIVNNEGKILLQGSTPTLATRPFEEVIADMGKLVNDLIAKFGITAADIESIGIGSPGAVLDGYVIFSNNLGWRNAPLCKELQKYINVPVYADNDANVAALAESTVGACKGYKNSITVTLGTGIGGGIVINNKLYAGSHGVGAEIGHMSIMANGIPCSCGGVGCWERYGSATALIREGRAGMARDSQSMIYTLAQGDENKVTAKVVIDAAKAGDKTACEIFDEYVRYIVVGLINLVNCFDPDVIAIGGGVAAAGDFLLDAVKECYEANVFYKDIPHAKIVFAQMGNDAGIVGAAMLS